MLRGANQARDIIARGIEENREVMLIGDPDVDGIFSLKLMCDLFDSWGVSYKYHINSNRRHGFTLNPESLRNHLVVMADFSISRACMETLIQYGCLVVVLDHHEIKDDFISYENGVVINNQYDFEPEEDRYLSGAGVVYETFTGLYPDYKSRQRQAIVGITLLSDVRQIENKKARAYLSKTFSSTDDYIMYLVDAVQDKNYGFGSPRMDRSFVDFCFSPMVNAMLRFNKTQAAINLIFGNGLPLGVNYHEKQKNLVKEMNKVVKVLRMSSLTVLAINTQDFVEDITSFIGLLCSRYKNEGKSAIIFAYDGNIIKRASFRGKYDDIDYNREFNKIGIHAEGHAGAFGIQQFTPSKDIWEQLNTLCETLEAHHGATYKVIETTTLATMLNSSGIMQKIATDNCYVRDMYRTFIKYKGTRVKVNKHTYRYTMFSDEDYLDMRPADGKIDGESYYYDRDSEGNKITKYLEYQVDGKPVKSFGTLLEDGYIMPMMEKGYVQLYVTDKKALG